MNIKRVILELILFYYSFWCKNKIFFHKLKIIDNFTEYVENKERWTGA